MNFDDWIQNNPITASLSVLGGVCSIGAFVYLFVGVWWASGVVMALVLIVALLYFGEQAVKRQETREPRSVTRSKPIRERPPSHIPDAKTDKALLNLTEERSLRRIRCPLCKGSGNKWSRYEQTCHKCNGHGHIYTYRNGRPPCPQCKGSGYKNARYEADCPVCDGVGLLPFEDFDLDHTIEQPGSK